MLRHARRPTRSADLTIDQPGTYRCELAFADASGNALSPASGWKPGPAISGSGSPLSTSLAAIPTLAGAQLAFALSAAGNVTAAVLNVAGRPIATTAADKPLEAGLQTLVRDRKAATALAVPSGLSGVN